MKGEGDEGEAKEGWFAEGPLRRLLGNASLLAGGRSLNGVFSVAAVALIVRSVDLETFGMLFLVHAVMSAISDVVKFQSWQAVLRYGSLALEQGRTMDFRRLVKLTVFLDLASALFGILVAVIAVPLVAPTLGWSPEWVPAIQLYAFSILFKVTATPTGLLRLFDRFDLLSVSKAIGSLLRVVGAVGIFFFGGDLETLLVIWFASTVASGLWLIGHSLRALSARGLLRGPRLGFRGLGSGHDGIRPFLLTTQANTTLSAGTRHFATIFVGLLLTPAAAGLYSIAGQVTTLLSRFARLMKPAIYPEFARLSAQNDVPAIRQLILRSMALMVGVGAVLVIPLVVFGRSLLGFAFGPEVEAAYGLVVWLSLAAAVRMLSFPLEPALISSGQAAVALRIRVVMVSVFLGTLFVLLPRVGLDGSGIAGLAAALVSFAGQGMAVFGWIRNRPLDVEAMPTSTPQSGPKSSGPAPGS
jgi:O-antigen/teichoic acid export membrane protein